jgi:aspartyl-tRNA(Asn)/glutamyl-tRNA(Gln) amidotransferase subunit C
MSNQGAVTLADVRRVAELANLELTPEEEPRMARDLNAILVHIAQLNELNTDDVPAMAQVGQILSGQMLAAGAPIHTKEEGADLRPDAVRPSIDRRAVMASAPETDGRFFKVPKVIER